MTLEEQINHLDAYFLQCREMLVKKGNDYAGADRLSSFKLSGAIIGQSGEQSCLNLIATKVSRLGQLIGAKKLPNNESVNDSIIDLTCYSILLNMLVNERAEPVILEHKEKVLIKHGPGHKHKLDYSLPA